MCDDLTRQEILFYTAFGSQPGEITKTEIKTRMAELALKMGWPKALTSVPRPLDRRLADATSGMRPMIVKTAPETWEGLSGVVNYVIFLANEHLDPPQRDMIMAELVEQVDAAE